ncbi:ABC transporter substrate-binding protein [Parasphingorhabdus sp. JC815]|uniref:ABC transporter substrate-binding protein n=1 Tax=Parasphingorhabdus sp. JC815 TaxID=3232140 RepID=UPI003458E08B
MIQNHRYDFKTCFIAMLASLCLSSCGLSGDQDQVHVTVIEDAEPVIKPVGINLNYASATTRAAIAKGLVGLDEEGRIVPALAVRWIVTDDGLSYIFRLNDTYWNDGREVTAERVAKLLRQRIRELRSSRLSQDLEAIAEIVSMTGRVIEIRLKSPHPNFLQLIAQPEMGLFRAGHGAGPMSVLSNGRVYTLGISNQSPTENEENDGNSDRDADEDSQNEDMDEDPRQITLRSENAAKALARYTSGHTDMILNGKFHHLPLVDEAGVNSNDLYLDPVAGLFGLKFIKADGFWALPANREILSMTIDRPALLTSFPKVSAWQSRHKIIPDALNVSGINARPDWSGMTMQDRQAYAREHVRRWEALEGQVPPLTIALPDAAGADILFLRIRSDLRRAGLDARKITLRDQRKNGEADVLLMDEIAPYDSAQWFLSRLTCSHSPVCLNDADDKIAMANAEVNLQTKARLYAEAEVLLVQHYSFIPLAVPVRWSIGKPGTRGFAVNQRGWHPLNYLVGIPIS